ncbi:MAG: hypothetical protein ACJ8BW_04060 [Ktedonobacteraceae bacterium]
MSTADTTSASPYPRKIYHVVRGYIVALPLFLVNIIVFCLLIFFLLKHPLPVKGDLLGWWKVVIFTLLGNFGLGAIPFSILYTRLVISPQGIIYRGPTFTSYGLGPFCTLYSNWENIVGGVIMEWYGGQMAGLRLHRSASQTLELREGIRTGQPVIKITKRAPRFINLDQYTRFIPLSLFRGCTKNLEQSKCFEDIQRYTLQVFPAQK